MEKNRHQLNGGYNGHFIHLIDSVCSKIDNSGTRGTKISTSVTDRQFLMAHMKF